MKRRTFLKSGALATGSILLPFPLLAQESKIKIGIVGTGWWAKSFLLPPLMASGQYEVVALCDVDSVAMSEAADMVFEGGGARPALYSSHKKMYDLDALQAVIISTPTHWHALQFIDACEKGLHVFLEKPVSYDIREGQAMLEAQRKAGNVVLVDFPRAMLDVNQEVKQYLDSGEAGEIFEAKANIISREGPLFEKAIPETMDFDTFCGPAPVQKYMCSEQGSKVNWRGLHAFSRGVMVDWGIHYIHNIRKVLDLDLPDKVSAMGGSSSAYPRENPDTLESRLDYDGLPVYWSHKTWGYVAPDPEHNIGVYYYGTKATIFAGDTGWRIYPVGGEDFIDHGEIRFRPGSPELRPVYRKMFDDMFSEFAEGIRRGSNDAITNKLEDAHLTTSAVNFADMAYREQETLLIDLPGINILENVTAQTRLKRNYRSPYIHP